MARLFLHPEHEEVVAAGSVELPQKMQRLASYSHMTGLDNSLLTIFPEGLNTFIPKEGDKTAPLLSLPTLISNEDAGPVPWSARAFRLYHLKVREVAQRDVFHVIWRVLLNGAKDAGFRGVMLVTAANFNLAHGPWQGAGWWQQLLEGSKDYFRLASETDPLLQALGPRILAGLPDSLADQLQGEEGEGSLQRLLSLLPQMPFLRERGPTVHMTRWASWMEAAEWMLPQNTARLLFLLFVGLQQGYVKPSNTQICLQDLDIGALSKVAPAASSTEEGELPGASGSHGPSMQAEKAQLGYLYAKCKNSLHVCTLIAGNEKWTGMSHMLLQTSRPYLDYLSHWRHFLRTRQEGLKFSVDAARGTTLVQHIFTSFNLFRDLQTLEQAGIIVSAIESDKRFTKLSESAAAVQQQDELMQEHGRLVMHCAKHLLRCMSETTSIFPRRFALLASDPEDVRACLRDMERLDKVALAAADRTERQWQQIARRSCLQLTVCEDVFRALRAVSFQFLPADVDQFVREVFSNFNSTGLTEDSFKYIKAEARRRTTVCLLKQLGTQWCPKNS